MEDTPPVKGEMGRARAGVAAIGVIHQMRAEGRTVATPAERRVLAGWPGWGPMAPMFGPKTQSWQDIAEQVEGMLSTRDVKIGLQGTYNAFYTPPRMAEQMWKLLEWLGLPGGKVLEAGCGGGVFMATAPEGVDVVGVERDPTAAAIAAARNPRHQVIVGELERQTLPDGFAAAIGNVPFAEVGVHDPLAPGGVRRSLHDYFVWRIVQALAPGGVAVLLTSRFTMDKTSDWARSEIGECADLIGAVRLPNGALEGGTDAMCDLLVLRRRHAGDRPKGRAWRDAEVWRAGTSLNKYWLNHPKDVLGEIVEGKTSQFGLGLRVDAHPGQVLDEAFPAALLRLAEVALVEDLTWDGPSDPAAFVDDVELVTAEGWEEGSFHWLNAPTGSAITDQVIRVEHGKPAGVKQTGELVALMALRDLAEALLHAEAQHHRSDASIEPLRVLCRDAYIWYVKRFGALNEATLLEGKPDEETGLPTYRVTRRPMGGFRSDPSAQLVFAIEDYNLDTGEHKPAPILSSRQNLPPLRPTRADSPAHALSLSLNHRAGRVDAGYIAGLLGVDESTVPGLLGDGVFCDPVTRVWVTAEEYLSGNVRVKHAQAQHAAATDPAFTRNVEALLPKVPKWLGPAQIVANINAPWISTKYVGLFITETLKDSSFGLERLNGNWELTGGDRSSVAATVVWGMDGADAFKLIHDALNGRVTSVQMEYLDEKGIKRVRKDRERSLMAAEKQQRLRAHFSKWIWQDAERAEKLLKLYNHRYNSLAGRMFSGEHIGVDGIAPWFSPYPWQMQMVARAISTPAVLCGHPVGAGKTATAGLVAMKLRQLGLVNKPMLVVLNHLLEQITRELRQLFPAAKILSASSERIAANRRLFAAQCATGDWDLVIITQPAFDLLKVSETTEAAYVAGQQDHLDGALRKRGGGRLEGRMIKAAAKRLDSLKTRIKDLMHRARGRDRGVTFEQFGVDYLIVDEAQYWKNLALPARTDGFTVRPSKRATNLDMIIDYLRRRQRGGPHLMLMTGTPVTNTMLELYVQLHYLMPDYLRTVGLGSADEFAAAFVQFVTSVDVTTDGGNFELRTRPALFINAPEMRMLLSQVADVRTEEQIGLKKPRMDLRIIVSQPTDVVQVYTMDLVARSMLVRNKPRSKMQKGDDNLLAICGDGRRCAAWPGLVGLHDPQDGKLHAVAREMLKVWREHPDALQIGFCDVGTPHPKKGSQLYGELRRLLVAGGMPAHRVRFIHEAKNQRSKQALFAQCRNGDVSVILGSTDKLGVGTNIQERVVAMHHIDAPFRPADVTQRDGRGLRPGNRYETVVVFRYVVERTFDAFMWQMLTRKIGFIQQVLSGSLDRTVEDVSSDQALSFAAIKAAATGQPLLMRRAEVEADLKLLAEGEREHWHNVQSLDRKIPLWEAEIGAHHQDRDMYAAIRDAYTGEPFTVAQGEALREKMAVFWGIAARTPMLVNGLPVTFEYWHDANDDRQPLMVVHGAGGKTTARCRKFTRPEALVKMLQDVVADAAYKPEYCQRTADHLVGQIAQARVEVAAPYADAARLAELRAELERIDVELHDAASNDDGRIVAMPATPPAAPVVQVAPLADLDGFLSALATDLRERERAAFAQLDELLRL